MENPLKQNPTPGIMLAVIILAILLIVHAFAGCKNSPGPSNPDATIWRIGNGTFCCELVDIGYRQPALTLSCGEVGDIYVFSTSLNTKVPCAE